MVADLNQFELYPHFESKLISLEHIAEKKINEENLQANS